jgi:crotonobetainyl-CoA:carnitine CoA-transferase CaiB-like acyl-CoA transferase
LADLGAEVIRIEDPAEADHSRWGPALAEQDWVLYAALHRNKKSMRLDLKNPRGREVLLRLIEGADVFIEGYRPSVKERLGIDYKVLEQVNPRLIYCSISGYGQDGPYRERAGHDINYLALGGALAITGEAGRPPVIPGIQVADIGAGGLFATIAILAALYARERSGRGQYLDVAMLDGMVAWLSVHAAEYLAQGHTLRRGQMWLSGKWACYNVYRTKEGGYLSLGALEPKFWANFCKAIGKEEFIPHQYTDGKIQQEMRSQVQEILLRKTRQEWMDFLGDRDVCCEPVLEIEEVFAHPQVLHRGMVVQTVHPSGQPLRLPNTPLRLSDAPARVSAPPPAIGQHSEELLRELGYEEEEIGALQEAGVI